MVTSSDPADSEGEVALQEVVELQLNAVPAVDPNLELEPVPTTKPVPTMLTDVPPRSGPADGLREVTVGTASKLNWSAMLVTEVPPGVVTVRSTVAGSSAGEVTVQLMVVQTTEVAAVAPKLTVLDPATKPVPVTVTTVPPPTGPTVGEMEVTPGATS
jgi:hypothetical protein